MQHSVVSGTYLPESASPDGTIPVIMAATTPVDDTDTVTVSQLPAADANTFGSGLSIATLNTLLDSTAGKTLATTTVSAERAYSALVSSDYGSGVLRADSSYWTPSPISYHGDRSQLTVSAVAKPGTLTWRDAVEPGGAVQPPLDSADTAFRALTAHSLSASVSTGTDWPRFQTIGTYAPAKIGTDPGEPGAHTWVPASLPGADEDSRRLLQNKPLADDASLTGYPADVPSLVMPLADIGVMTNPAMYTNVTNHDAPISAIRVRVAGVTGTDALSRSRVQTVADEISQRTGLDVDVTYGASRVPATITLPAGLHGRPPLRLTETWYRKNVQVAFLSSVDRRTSTLLILVLLICGLIVANATASTLRRGRHTLPALSRRGWSRTAILRFLFAIVVTEGLAAGLLAAGVSWALSPLVHPRPDSGTLGDAVPIGLAIACLTATWPVWRAASQATAETRRKAGRKARSSRQPNRVRLRGVASLAMASLLDTPLRTVAAMGAVAVGTAAATLQVMLIWYWHGAVVGSLASHPYAIENHSVDGSATAVLLLMAAIVVGDVAWLGVSERLQQFAELHVLGWPGHAVVRVVAYQALAVACGGAAVGAAAALLIATVFTGVVAPLLFGMAAVGAGIGAVVGLAASSVSLHGQLLALRV